MLYFIFYFWLVNMCIAGKIARGGGLEVRDGLGMASYGWCLNKQALLLKVPPLKPAHYSLQF